MILPCRASGIFHRNARPFSLYPPMPYSQALDHSVTDGLTKNYVDDRNPFVSHMFEEFYPQLEILAMP